MKRNATRVLLALCGLALLGTLNLEHADACGGFFCQLVPINQAGEQIIFRQEGDMVTAIVLIQYAGDAADFSWVVPVPGIPELSTGSDLLFAPLEQATRPQFTLERTGQPCLDFSLLFPAAPADGVFDFFESDSTDNGVDILQILTVGPFDVQVVTSDDATALATWLTDNNYDLSDRGIELITPYVDQGMNFVALRLLQDRGVGDLQPLIMRYVSPQPMIPIRLTAVAAQQDMGVIVWLLGDSRAVPLNYLHVTPNYTRLNWYNGNRNAYINYQTLITAAMDEAGGQGFATDFAGRDPNLITQLPDPSTFTTELVRLSAVTRDAEVIASTANGFIFQQNKVLEILRRLLPLPIGQGEFIYQIPDLLEDVFTVDQLTTARAGLLVELNDTIVIPLIETLAIFDGNPYMTRLYTTLSPEEMTLDPVFSFNPDLGDQSINRLAKLNMSCGLLGSEWTLTLGAGTDRDGQLVINGVGDPPGFTPPVINQDAVWRTEMIDITGPPTIMTQKQFGVAQVIGTGASDLQLCGSGTGVCGVGIAGALLMMMFGLRLFRRR